MLLLNTVLTVRQGEPNSHASAMMRSLDHASSLVQVGIRNISEEEVKALPGLNTTIFYDWNMRDDPKWMDEVLAKLHVDRSHKGKLPMNNTSRSGH